MIHKGLRLFTKRCLSLRKNMFQLNTFLYTNLTNFFNIHKNTNNVQCSFITAISTVLCIEKTQATRTRKAVSISVTYSFLNYIFSKLKAKSIIYVRCFFLKRSSQLSYFAKYCIFTETQDSWSATIVLSLGQMNISFADSASSDKKKQLSLWNYMVFPQWYKRKR